MKDKLRELAELDEAACVPVNRPNLYASGWNDCRSVVLAILDAEGDGGAVGDVAAWQYRILDDEEGPSPYWHDMTRQQFEMFREAANPRYELRQLYTHPAPEGDGGGE